MTDKDLCLLNDCPRNRLSGMHFCDDHERQLHYYGYGLLPKGNSTISINSDKVSKTEVINDHIKVNIEQTAKGARVTVCYDRSDHSIDEAVLGAVNTYEQIIEELKQRGIRVDGEKDNDSKSS